MDFKFEKLSTATIGPCRDCFYWQQVNKSGVCHRFPPVFVGMKAEQPITWGNTTCGEFVDKTATPEA